MIKVVHYIWSNTIGGLERVAIDLANTQYNSEKYHPVVLVGQRADSQDEGAFEICCPKMNAGLLSGTDFSISKYRSLLKQFKTMDVIHLHTFHPIVALAAHYSGRPIVYTVHGGLSGHKRLSIRYWLKRKIRSYFINKSVSVTTFNSNYTKNRAKKLLGINNKDLYIIYNGTNIYNNGEGMSAREHASSKKKFIIGTFSRLYESKRIDRLIHAFSEFQKSNVSHLMIVGDGPERRKLENLASALGIHADVTFTGYRSRVEGLIREMDVCVFPAENEAFGLVAIEALALGKPAIVYADGGGLPEIIAPLEPLDVVRDEGSLIERLLQYKETGRSVEDEQRRLAYAGKFSLEKMASDYGNIYTRALRSK